MRPTAYRRNARGLRDRQAFEHPHAGRRAVCRRPLPSRGPTGPDPRLSQAQRAAIDQALRQGARAHGFDTDHWTLARITTVIERLAGVAYHPGHTWKLLRRMGWRLRRGHTPVIRHHFKWKRMSMAAALAGGPHPAGLPPRRVRSLPPRSQQLLLTAAAEPLGDVALLWHAAERLAIGADALGPAEAAGLIEVGARVRFRHPLVRSATYRAAAPSDRRQAHRALAEATDSEADPDRRAWHRAHAATGLDEAVAEELERSADRAQSRGGVAAMAAFLERAAELTPDPGRRGARALAAAQAKLDAGAPEAAHKLLATAELTPLDELRRARLQRLRAQIAFARKRGRDAPPLLLDAAKRFEPLDAASARETYLEAFGAAIFAGREGRGSGVVEVAEAARAAPSAPGPPRPIDVLLNGLAKRFTETYENAVPTP